MIAGSRDYWSVDGLQNPEELEKKPGIPKTPKLLDWGNWFIFLENQKNLYKDKKVKPDYLTGFVIDYTIRM